MTKKIFFREFGNGKKIVILHGILGSSDMWIPVARRLSECFHVVVPDLPNHGLSPHTESIGFGDIAQALCNFLKDNKIPQPIVIAHSYGAKVAFQMMADGFEMAGLVAVDMLPATTFADAQIALLLDFIKQPLPCLKTFAQAKQLFAHYGIAPRFANLLAKGMTVQNGTLQWKFNARLIASNADTLCNSIVFNNIQSIPLLVIKGEQSNYVDSTAIACAKQYFENITLTEIPDAGHWVHYDQPEKFYNTVYNYITNL